MTPLETATELIHTFGDLASNVCDEVLMNVMSLPERSFHYLEVKKIIAQQQENN